MRLVITLVRVAVGFTFALQRKGAASFAVLGGYGLGLLAGCYPGRSANPTFGTTNRGMYRRYGLHLCSYPALPLAKTTSNEVAIVSVSSLAMLASVGLAIGARRRARGFALAPLISPRSRWISRKVTAEASGTHSGVT
jgi:hypothetical protein